MMNTETDNELFQLCIAGNEEAFNRLYLKYEPIVKKTVYRFTPKNMWSERDDICQYFWFENFLRFASNSPPKNVFKNWIVSCATKAVFNYIRKATAKKYKFCNHNMSHNELFQPIANCLSPENVAIIAEEAGISKEALDKIHPAYKETITTLILDGMSWSEYAKKRGILITSVSRCLDKALNSLRNTQEIKSLALQC